MTLRDLILSLNAVPYDYLDYEVLHADVLSSQNVGLEVKIDKPTRTIVIIESENDDICVDEFNFND